MKYLLAIIIFTIAPGCNFKKENTETKEINQSANDTVLNSPITILQDSTQDDLITDVEDTLQYYTKRKSFKITSPFNSYVVNGFTVDNNRFCVIITVTYIYIYQYSQGKFRKVYHEEYGALYQTTIKFQDLNWDNFLDINIIESGTFSTLLLYHPPTKTYIRGKHGDLTHVSLDNKNKFIRAHNQRGACWAAHKTLYRFAGDSLVMHKRLVCDPKCYEGGDIVLTSYENKNGIITQDSIAGKPGKIWSIYYKRLWNNRYYPSSKQ